MLADIAHLLIETAFGFFIFLLLLRFYMQLLRAPFRNPVGQLVTALSNWIVLPARRVIPGWLGIDLATLLLAWAAEAIMLLLLLSLRGFAPGSAPGIATAVLLSVAALELVRYSLHLLIGVVLVQVVMSWVNPHAPFAPLLDALTRPFYRVFKRFIPPIGGIDLSPLFVVVLAQVVLIPLGVLLRAAQAPM